MVLVSRQEAYAVGAHVVVAPITTRVRRIATHVDVGEREGVARTSAVNCGLLLTVTPGELIEPLGALGTAKLEELDEALKFALGLE